MTDFKQSADFQRRVTQLSDNNIKFLHLLKQFHQISCKFNNNNKLILKQTLFINSNNLIFSQHDKFHHSVFKKMKTDDSINKKSDFVAYEEFMILK